MSRKRAIAPVLGAASLLLLLAGCGAGAKSSTSHTAPTPTVPRSTPTTATTPPTSSIPSTNGAPTAVLPAQFAINPDGSVSPPVVSGPVDTTIALSVTSRASHPVTLTVASTSLTLPPRGRASARLAGLKAGRYTIKVDGAARAALVVGAQPGP